MDKKLNFSYNWNNKLNCKVFTSLRMTNRFDIGDRVEISLKDKPLGVGIVKGKKSFLIDGINDFIAYIDTGYNRDECIKMLKRMNKISDWSKKKIHFYLIKMEVAK